MDGAFGLTVNTAGITTFGGAVGGNTALASLTTDAPGTTAINGGAVNTSGAQAYNDAVTLRATDTLTTANAPVTFASTVDAANAGVQGLTVAAGTGKVIFGSTVGATAKLASLTVTGPTTLGGNVTTSGTQNYNGAVTLGATDTLTTANAAVSFVSTVDAASAGAQGLTVAAGTGAVTFGGAVGATATLASLTVTGPTTLGGNVTTSGAQTYNSPTFLAATDTLTTANAAVKFASTVDATSAGIQGLTVAAGTGAVTFGSTVGATAKLASLTVTGPTTLGGNVTTSGAQAYNSAVTLAASDALTTTNAAVTFGVTVDATVAGAQGLVVSTGSGAIAFGGNVGGTAALASLTAGGGTITLGGDVTTKGGPITLTQTAPGATLSLAHNLTAPGQVLSLTVAGPISQTAGVITAATLTGSSNGDVVLADSNNITTLASFSSGGAFKLTDATALNETGPVTAVGPLTLTTIGAGSNLTLAGNLTAAGQTVTLVSGGANHRKLLGGHHRGDADRELGRRREPDREQQNRCVERVHRGRRVQPRHDSISLSLAGNQTAPGQVVTLGVNGTINQASGILTAGTPEFECIRRYRARRREPGRQPRRVLQCRRWRVPLQRRLRADRDGCGQCRQRRSRSGLQRRADRQRRVGFGRHFPADRRLGDLGGFPDGGRYDGAYLDRRRSDRVGRRHRQRREPDLGVGGQGAAQQCERHHHAGGPIGRDLRIRQRERVDDRLDRRRERNSFFGRPHAHVRSGAAGVELVVQRSRDVRLRPAPTAAI